MTVVGWVLLGLLMVVVIPVGVPLAIGRLLRRRRLELERNQPDPIPEPDTVRDTP